MQRDYSYYRRIFEHRPCRLPSWTSTCSTRMPARCWRGRRQAGTPRLQVAAQRGDPAAHPRSRRLFSGHHVLHGARGRVLAAQGFDDLLIGYPCWHEDDIAAVARATAQARRSR